MEEPQSYGLGAERQAEGPSHFSLVPIPAEAAITATAATPFLSVAVLHRPPFSSSEARGRAALSSFEDV